MNRVERWRLILGKTAEQALAGACGMSGEILNGEMREIDGALGAIYDEEEKTEAGRRSAGLGGSAPRLAKWLGDIRSYFNKDVVSVIQMDAIE